MAVSVSKSNGLVAMADQHLVGDTDAGERPVAMDNADWRPTVTVADHEITDDSGRIRVNGDVEHVIET